MRSYETEKCDAFRVENKGRDGCDAFLYLSLFTRTRARESAMQKPVTSVTASRLLGGKVTEKQEAQFRKLIEYVQELARQHNEVGDMRTARGAELGAASDATCTR